MNILKYDKTNWGLFLIQKARISIRAFCISVDLINL
jgi:hypothetical protein